MSESTTPPAGLRIGHVRGVTLTRWRRVWAERFNAPLHVVEVADGEQLSGLREGSLDMCFVRLPIDREGLHAIELYEEQFVAWVSKEHPISVLDAVTLADLDAETVLRAPDTVAVDRVLAGAVLVVPMSIARGASRRDLAYRPISDAPPSPVALAWRIDDDNPLLDEFVGVVRGRTANSSRTQQERASSGVRREPRQSGVRGGQRRETDRRRGRRGR